ncbi:MAG: tRNA (adenosine(37)-N6)-dimethylallyltransferase MiaA [Clostridiales bacterium]|nr:tRNA (adenosine(37)-N6)-dimethylallyltransferase MiaA [Clostridiales bacterium]
MNKIPLLVITGPTASGKTDLAIQVAQQLNGEIISADSMQIYRYMDIGTAKPSIDERQGIPHHMIDVRNPDDEFNVSMFQKLSSDIIRQITKRGKIPILAGGTGFYISSIIYPMNFTDAVEDPEYRSHLNKLLDQHGTTWLHNHLRRVDPVSAQRLHPNDTRRVIRAMEVFHLTGKTMEAFRQDFSELDSPYSTRIYGLTMDRQLLYDRINLRVDRMIESGLIEEVKEIMDRGYSRNLVSMQGLGYKEIVDYLKGLSTQEESINILKRNTRRFAKRQIAWFKREEQIIWLDPFKMGDLKTVGNWLITDIGNNLLSN